MEYHGICGLSDYGIYIYNMEYLECMKLIMVLFSSDHLTQPLGSSYLPLGNQGDPQKGPVGLTWNDPFVHLGGIIP